METFKYVVSTTGDTYDEKGTSTTFVENHYFKTLEESLYYLLSKKLPEFTSMKFPEIPASYLKIVQINPKNDFSAISLREISFHEGASTQVPAGIYLAITSESEQKKLAEITGINLDPAFVRAPDGTPLLPLAEYKYDKGFQIKYLGGVNQLLSQLEPAISQEPPYMLTVREKSVDSQFYAENLYPFSQIASAMATLSTLTLTDTDPKLVAGHKSMFLEQATIRVADNTILGLHNSVVNSEGISWPYRGVYFHLPNSPAVFSHETGVDINSLLHFQTNENRHFILIGKYESENTKILPTEQYLGFSSSIKHKATLDEKPYHLHFFKEHGGLKQVPLQFSLLQEAFEKFVSIERKHMEENGFNKVVLMDDSSKIEIGRKFIVEQDQYLAKGFYVKINQEDLSIETLKVLSPVIKQMQHNGSFYFSIKEEAPDILKREAPKTRTLREDNGFGKTI